MDSRSNPLSMSANRKKRLVVDILPLAQISPSLAASQYLQGKDYASSNRRGMTNSKACALVLT